MIGGPKTARSPDHGKKFSTGPDVCKALDELQPTIEDFHERSIWSRSQVRPASRWQSRSSRALVILFWFAIALTLAPRRLLAQYPSHPLTTAAITAADLSARDKAISDDSFQGRGPGTPAGEAAADWIADEMKRIGLPAGNHGSYFQPVPAVTNSPSFTTMRIER
jgi:hypothetical protein